jgi:hypothetical protein
LLRCYATVSNTVSADSADDSGAGGRVFAAVAR